MSANAGESSPGAADHTGSRPTQHLPAVDRHRTPRPDSDKALRELTIAARRDAREPNAPQAPARRRGVLLAVFVGTGIGLAVGWLIPPRYRCTATFTTRHVRTDADRRLLGTNLLERWWYVLEQQTGDPTRIETARLDWAGGESLTINVTTGDPERTTALLQGAAEAFIESLRRRVAASRKTPTKAEQVLTDYANTLQRDLAEADEQVHAAMTALPEADPRSKQGALLGQWEQVHTEFEAQRNELTGASASLAHLHAEPEPSHGIVSAAERSASIQADTALRNDLDELLVNLSELKLHLLNIGGQTMPLLDALASAADAMRSAAAGATRNAIPVDLKRILTRIETASARYRESFEGFAQTWRQTFSRIRTQDVDPMTASILGAHQELTEGLNGFLFDGATPLTAMRGAVNAIGQLKSDNARYHVLQSDLARAFHTLQTAHHRFEFAAGGIDGTNRFRLDAARRSAYGLHRRTQARIRHIDAALQKKAFERMRQNHQQALVSAETLVQRVRSVTDETVDQLVQLQQRLNATTVDSETFHEAQRSLDIAVGKLEVTRTHLDDTQARLARLEANRLTTDTDLGATLISCGVVGGSINRGERFRAAGLAFGISILTVLLGQWWATRKR